MTAVAVYLVVVVAFAALCCGHVGEEFPIPLRGAWRGLWGVVGPLRGSADAGPRVRPSERRTAARGARPAPAVTAPSRPHVRRWSAPQDSGGGFPAPTQLRPSQGRPAPSWANTQPIKET